MICLLVNNAIIYCDDGIAAMYNVHVQCKHVHSFLIRIVRFQAVYRKHVSLNLKQLTGNNQNARRALKMLMALSLLPANNMFEGLQQVWQYSVLHEFHQEFQPIIDYMNEFWLQTVGAEKCSVFRQVHRTNNSVEGFYSYLFDRMRSKPSVWDFTGNLNINIV